MILVEAVIEGGWIVEGSGGIEQGCYTGIGSGLFVGSNGLGDHPQKWIG